MQNISYYCISEPSKDAIELMFDATFPGVLEKASVNHLIEMQNLQNLQAQDKILLIKKIIVIISAIQHVIVSDPKICFTHMCETSIELLSFIFRFAGLLSNDTLPKNSSVELLIGFPES